MFLACLVLSTALPASQSDYWAFRPLAAPPVPVVKATVRVRTPIDAFVLHKLEAARLTLAPDAERAVLLRRVYFDLIGLPPSPKEVDAFLKDAADGAYERVVDRLLAMPQYGERWGRHWLDAAGYADTTGTDNDFNGGKVREGMWRYRDYVVRSLNADKPFDRFLLEQLAGDQLFEWTKETAFTPEQKELLIATGMLRTAVDATHNVERNRPMERYQLLHDSVEILGSNLFGLTVACARCHDHKFDPISQKDYYRFMAYLTPAYNPQAWIQPQNRHLVVSTQAEMDEIKKANAELDRKAGELGGRQGKLRRPYETKLTEEKYSALPEALRADLMTALATGAAKQTEVQKYLVEKLGPLVRVKHEEVVAALGAEDRKAHDELEHQVRVLRASRREVEKLQAMWDVGPAPTTFLLRQGNHETPGPEVEPGLPAALLGAASGPGGSRLALAKSLTEPGTPTAALVARAQVNRLWHHHFGRGIVATPGNLGRSGASPTHPELLEWLASEFVRGGWKLKPIHRLIVTSTAYRQASRVKVGSDPDPVTLDPDNKLLWRANLRRLESEAVRDAMLSVAGTLDLRVGGPYVPLEGRPDGTVVTSRNHPDPDGSRRRSLYLFARRNFHLSLLAAFDQPLMGTNCSLRRTSAAVPQALSLLNDGAVIDAAESFAKRVAEGAEEPTARLRLAFRLALVREPSADELKWAAELMERHERRGGRSLTHLCHMLLCTNEFLYVE